MRIHTRRFIWRRAKLDGRWVDYLLHDQPVEFLKGTLHLWQVTRLCDDGHRTQVIKGRLDLRDIELQPHYARCLSYQRTMLDWVRTGISLATFGFAIHNFHHFLDDGRVPQFPHRATPARADDVDIGLAALLLARHDIRIPACNMPTFRGHCCRPQSRS